MVESVSTQQSLRKALGALKDATKVGLAKVNSDYKELDVAIVKSTNHDEEIAKEKHILKIFYAVSASRPRADVAYCIHGLARRLAKTHNWAVALKTSIVIHRALREVDPTFREELINYTRSRGHMLNLSHFKDDSSPNAWDYSSWVRMYALYLQECLECFHILKYDVEHDHLRTRDLNTPDLLEQLPALQELLFRLLACQPVGAAMYNNMIQYALSIVSGESVRLYAAINDGTLNLVDKFFEMQRHDAVRALEIYRKAGYQAERLSEFYEVCRGLESGRGQMFIKIEMPPTSFLTAMEEYAREAPCSLMLQQITVNDDRETTAEVRDIPKVELEVECKKEMDGRQNPNPSAILPEPPRSDQSEAAVVPHVIDLLGQAKLSQEASELDLRNSLALAIVTSGQTTGWELALVSASGSNGNAIAESKLAGGMDKLTLDSLYEDAMAKRLNQNGAYHFGQVTPNPFEVAQYPQDPFYASSRIAPPTNVQMAAIAQQQEAFMMQQQQQPMIGQDPTNPFGNPFMNQGVQPYPPHNQGLI